MNENFSEDEKLYRAVRPWDIFWKTNGKLSSAAFKDKNGLSVERGDHREDSDVVDNMRKNQFEGKIVSLNVQQCYSVNALVKYLPSRKNIYHSEIHKDENTRLLSDSQCRNLVKMAIIVSE